MGPRFTSGGGVGVGGFPCTWYILFIQLLNFLPGLVSWNTITKAMATLTCKCGGVELTLGNPQALWRLECCCHDCYAAPWYLQKRKNAPAAPEVQLLDSIYFANNLTVEKGMEKLGTYKNFPCGDTTRFVCTDCWTVLAADHPAYGGKLLVTQVTNYKGFDGLRNAKLIEKKSRHFLCDLPDGMEAQLPPFTGDPTKVYDKASACLLEAFPRIQEAAGEPGVSNGQTLAAQCGSPFIPDDEPERMRGGPKTFMGSDPKARASDN